MSKACKNKPILIVIRRIIVNVNTAVLGGFSLTTDPLKDLHSVHIFLPGAYICFCRETFFE